MLKMSNLIKDIYNLEFYKKLSFVLKNVINDFDQDKFIELIFDEKFESYELKERMYHTANVLHIFLPKDFSEASEILCKCVKFMNENGIKENVIEFMLIPEYISKYGIDFYKESIKAIEIITQFTSCEFAIRPFIIQYESESINQLLKWSKHSNFRVRRLASEGSRPRLPWAIALPNFKKDPTLIIPILENLKNDENEIVRRSVANNLNDISKDNPNIVIDLAKKWMNNSNELDNLIKHALRSLLKSTHPAVLSLYNLKNDFISIKNQSITTLKVKLKSELVFDFTIHNSSINDEQIRLEYAIYFLKNNGNQNKKVFKISEKTYKANSLNKITKKHSFRLITTRKYYLGNHKVSVIVNGKEEIIGDFELID